MKQLLSSRLLKPIGKVLLGTCLFAGSLGLQAQTGSKEYTAAEAADLLTDMEAETYAEYILSESGGVYDVYDIDISGSFTIKAKEGLAARPIMKYSADPGSYKTFFDLAASDATVLIKGISFDGTTTGTEIMGITRADKANVALTIDSCEITGFTGNEGFVRLERDGVSLSFTNNYVHDVKKGVRIDNDKVDNVKVPVAIGAIVFQNSSFVNCEGDAITWNSLTMSSVSSVSVDQCTFYNITTADVLKIGESTTPVSITNCVFDDVAKDINLYPGDGTKPATTATFDYCYQDFGESLHSGATVTNEITTAPTYVDAANLDLTLTNATTLKGSDAYTPIGDPRWFGAGTPTAVESDTLGQVTVFGSYRAIQVSLDQLNANVKIFSLNGILVASQQRCSNTICFDVPQGVYIVRIDNESSTSSKRVIVQ